MEPAQHGEDVTDRVTCEVACQTQEGVTDGVEVHTEDATCYLVQELEATALVAEDAGEEMTFRIEYEDEGEVELITDNGC